MEWIFYIFIGLAVITAFFGKSSDEDCDKYDSMFDSNCFDYWIIGPGSQQDDLFYEDPWKNDAPYDDTWNSPDDIWKND